MTIGNFKITYTNEVAVIRFTDYYPYGSVMRSEGEKYRFGYQGEFAEQDDETGWSAFELRMYDSKIGRWMAPDPYGQYWSPYMAMGNNPMSLVDPDGGMTFPIFTTEMLDMFMEAILSTGDYGRFLDEVTVTGSLNALDHLAIAFAELDKLLHDDDPDFGIRLYGSGGPGATYQFKDWNPKTVHAVDGEQIITVFNLYKKKFYKDIKLVKHNNNSRTVKNPKLKNRAKAILNAIKNTKKAVETYKTYQEEHGGGVHGSKYPDSSVELIDTLYKVDFWSMTIPAHHKFTDYTIRRSSGNKVDTIIVRD